MDDGTLSPYAGKFHLQTAEMPTHTVVITLLKQYEATPVRFSSVLLNLEHTQVDTDQAYLLVLLVMAHFYVSNK